MNELWLAFEGGGTRTRILLADPSGTVHAREDAGSASPLYVAPADYAREVRPLLKRLERRARALGGQVTAAGLGGPMNAALVQAMVQSVFGPIEVVCSGEAEIAHALYGLTYGASLVAGTGASCRCVDEQGQGVSCGGGGPQFDDVGSAYWIGRAGIAAAMRSLDGRDSKSALEDAVCRQFGVERPWDILRMVDLNGHVPAPRVAAFARSVSETADGGDVSAGRILNEAGRALGKLVLATVRKSSLRIRPIPLVLTGGVFNAGRWVLGPLRRVLSASDTAFKVYPPVPDPTAGLINIIAAQRNGRNVHVS